MIIGVDGVTWYVLDGHRVREGSLEEYVEMLSAPDARRVRRTSVDGVVVSTVFLLACTPPESFETMVTGGAYDQWVYRYTTWDEAEAGHARIVDALQRGESL